MLTDTETQLLWQKLLDTLDTLSPADFRRLHKKLVDGVIILEWRFAQRYPAEWLAHELAFYGANDNDTPRRQ